jgi:hypothetical protein
VVGCELPQSAWWALARTEKRWTPSASITGTSIEWSAACELPL